jgi:DNA mismatch repair protein MutL
MTGHQQHLRTSLFSPSPRQEWPAEHDEVARTVPSSPPMTTAEPMVQPRLPQVPVRSASPQVVPAVEAPVVTAPMLSRPAIMPTTVEKYSGLTLIGQLFALYLLCERDGQFIVIDQHAAHERLLYGQLLQGYRTAQMPRQILMFPMTVELTPVQVETLERRAEAVAALGLQAEHFGDATVVVKAVPAVVSHVDPGALLREVLDGLRGPVRTEIDRPVPQAVDDLLASMACKAAIKAGNRLQPVEMLKLLQQMEASDVFSHCPHGRPVLKAFSTQEVERWFHRHGG